MTFDWVEWFGYLASLVVLISLTMPSIIKLRVINLIGSLLFASFAYLIDSMPTVFVNLSIAVINIYYLWQMYHTKEQFKIISTTGESEYFQHFINVNQDDIEKQITIPELKQATASFYMLRDNNVAGILCGNMEKDGVFNLLLDYVLPRYRDFKLGNYYYNTHPAIIKTQGIKVLKTTTHDKEHSAYLKKMNFSSESEQTPHTYIKRL